jgi:hypothetical protein
MILFKIPYPKIWAGSLDKPKSALRAHPAFICTNEDPRTLLESPIEQQLRRKKKKSPGIEPFPTAVFELPRITPRMH